MPSDHSEPATSGSAAALRPSPWSVRRATRSSFTIGFVILFFESAVHSLVRQHGGLPDLLHEPRAHGLLPRDERGLPRAARKRDMINAVIPLMLLAVGLSYAVLWGYNTFGAGDDRRRRAGVAAAGLLRHGVASQGSVAVRGPD